MLVLVPAEIWKLVVQVVIIMLFLLDPAADVGHVMIHVLQIFSILVSGHVLVKVPVVVCSMLHLALVILYRLVIDLVLVIMHVNIILHVMTCHIVYLLTTMNV